MTKISSTVWQRRSLLGALAALGLGGSAAAAVLTDDGLRRQIAPSGRIRAAINLGNVVLAQRGGTEGATGPTVDIAREIGRRLGVPVDLLNYDAAGAVVAGLARDRWDVAFMGIDSARAGEIQFTAPYCYIDGTYMVRGPRFATTADLDRPGVTIAVGRGAAYDLYLSRTLKHATLVYADTSPLAIQRFDRDGLDAVAGVRQSLVQAQRSRPDCLVLSDAFNRIEQAIAVPKGRPEALGFVRNVLAEMTVNGFLQAAFDRAGQADVPLAPATSGN